MATSETITACSGCGALVPETDGASHPYLGTTPGCWAIFGAVIAREYSNAQYASVHNLTVDAYALQHPGTPSRQTIHSAAIHLISLYAHFEQGRPPTNTAHIKQKASRQRNKFVWLEPPVTPGAITILDVHAAPDATRHIDVVSKWASTVWAAWHEHHATIRQWAAL